MTCSRRTIALSLLSALAAGSIAAAGDWPSWRGPGNSGFAPAADPPLQWSEERNVRFKVDVPGRGLASPIVANGRVYLLTTVPLDAGAYAESMEVAEAKQEFPPDVQPVGQRYVLLAYHAGTGELLWKRTAVEKTPHESHYVASSWASASALTDGKRIYAHFGSAGTYAFDLGGKLLWSADLGDQKTRRGFGEGSSPAIHGERLVINWDHEGGSFLTVLDAATGKVVWKVDRPDEPTSWGTPMVVEAGGRTQIVVTGTGKSRGYDLKNGEVIWEVAGMTVNSIPTPIHADGVAYLTSGYRGNMLQAVDLGKAKGDLWERPGLRWSYDRDTPYVPSPVLVNERIYFIKGNGNVLTSLNAKTGKLVYKRHPPLRHRGRR